jgi:hypothetical protein
VRTAGGPADAPALVSHGDSTIEFCVGRLSRS